MRMIRIPGGYEPQLPALPQPPQLLPPPSGLPDSTENPM